MAAEQLKIASQTTISPLGGNQQLYAQGKRHPSHCTPNYPEAQAANTSTYSPNRGIDQTSDAPLRGFYPHNRRKRGLLYE